MTKIPFFDLKRQFGPLREEILSELAQVCDSQVFVLGSKVDALEAEIASLCGAGHAIGTSSGTDAELLILMALGIGRAQDTDSRLLRESGTFMRATTNCYDPIFARREPRQCPRQMRPRTPAR